jgi:dTDP-glucose 4,6-dehydratase
VLGTTDDHVTVFDALTYAGNLDNLTGLDEDPRFTFVKGDVCDRAAVEDAMQGHDAVLHFAAETHVDRSIASSDDFIRTNCVGTNVVMDVAQKIGVSRVIHVSTDEVYGSVEIGSSTESDPLEPRSPYSASKAGSDLIALSHHATYGTPVIVTRSSNNFGPYQFPEKVIPLFVTNLLDGRKVPLYGDGLNIRDWLHVDDHCRGIDLLLSKGTPGEVYNIGGGNEVKNVDLTYRILELTGKTKALIKPVADRLGHDRRYCLDTSKLKSMGWAPQANFETGLAATVDWYKNNEWWWRPIKENDPAFREYYATQYGSRPPHA